MGVVGDVAGVKLPWGMLVGAVVLVMGVIGVVDCFFGGCCWRCWWWVMSMGDVGGG